MNNSQEFNGDHNQNLEEDLLPEYKFDYSEARPNRFAVSPSKIVTVELESDVAEVFKSSKDVNNALRAIISIMPKR
jgi:hypothetical protein